MLVIVLSFWISWRPPVCHAFGASWHGVAEVCLVWLRGCRESCLVQSSGRRSGRNATDVGCGTGTDLRVRSKDERSPPVFVQRDGRVVEWSVASIEGFVVCPLAGLGGCGGRRVGVIGEWYHLRPGINMEPENHWFVEENSLQWFPS